MPSLLEAVERKKVELGLNQRQMCEVIGLNHHSYNKVLRGERTLALRIARNIYALGIPASLILGDTDAQDV